MKKEHQLFFAVSSIKSFFESALVSYSFQGLLNGGIAFVNYSFVNLYIMVHAKDEFESI